jgi:hypothetical protein
VEGGDKAGRQTNDADDLLFCGRGTTAAYARFYKCHSPAVSRRRDQIARRATAAMRHHRWMPERNISSEQHDEALVKREDVPKYLADAGAAVSTPIFGSVPYSRLELHRDLGLVVCLKSALETTMCNIAYLREDLRRSCRLPTSGTSPQT